MTGEKVALLVTAIASLTGLITFFVSRHDKSKDPLPKQTAEVALAKEMLLMVETSAQRLNSDVVRLTARIDAQDAKILRLETQREQDAATIDTQQTKITGLERRVTGMIEDRDALVAYVVTFRRWVATGARPPAPTVPRHLADVLPAWESGDGAEVTTEPRTEETP